MTQLLVINSIIVLTFYLLTFTVLKNFEKSWSSLLSGLTLIFSLIYFVLGYHGLKGIVPTLSIAYDHVIPIVQIICSLSIIVLNSLGLLLRQIKLKKTLQDH